MTSLDQLYKSYKVYLESESPAHYKKLLVLERSNPEGARSEAVVHNLLNSHRIIVTHYEHPDSGGPDFFCNYLENKFVVEATCIESDTITNKSGIQNKMPETVEANSFSYITSLLRSKASDKANQLANIPYPRILAITCEHIGAGILFSCLAVQNFMTSDTKIRVNLQDSSANHQEITDLHDSVFFRYNKYGKIESCRTSISAILLVEINNDSCRIYGLLHPDPAYEFRYELLPTIPFLRINPWPIIDNRIYTEWVIDSPDPFTSYYFEFKV